MGIEEIECIVGEIGRHISNPERECLYHLARSSNVKRVVAEIGSGYSSQGKSKKPLLMTK